ncbi:NisI/SpaI family lantibiotic immunity lipoprotein [Coprococcus comes]|uniref:NisI/SpaI family lantibiotic immunity lipoprotein n=1 Tax=Coprococcus comes TaxID=410072 RepID=UPI00321A1F8A
MKNSILIKRVILVFCMISIMIIGSGCAAKKTVLENQGKTECYLDEKDATKFIYNGQQYTILNNTVDKNSLGDWIGFIQKYVALDENYNILKKCDMGVNVVGDLSDLIDHTDGTAYYVPYLNVCPLKTATCGCHITGK